MHHNLHCFCIRDGKKIAAIASAAVDPEGGQFAEMTGFATLPEYRGGRGFSGRLLRWMETKMRSIGIKTAFAIVRARSYPANITFARAGYTHAGGTVPGCVNICGSFEDMSVWYRLLDDRMAALPRGHLRAGRRRPGGKRISKVPDPYYHPNMDTDNLPAYDAVVVGGAGPPGAPPPTCSRGGSDTGWHSWRGRGIHGTKSAPAVSARSPSGSSTGSLTCPSPPPSEEGLLDFAGTDYALYVGSNRVLAGGDLAEPFYFTQRERYDACLARKAVDAGTEVREGVEVTAVDHAGRTVTTSDGGDRYTGRVIIGGADGIHSGVRRSLPESVFEHDRWRENLGWAMELAIPPQGGSGAQERGGRGGDPAGCRTRDTAPCP
ncbi:GNAT family N-acetyltransferase [Methanoculleus chikugoensis]|uniref:GNAT family N-acetyltransferase n=1 Tax=Methanoculleus chikugoensis TaxID=118126 RepID=UPI000B0DFC4D|nr:GNAT family N-acetyltransferase [Methanoculleus chikugoensis]